MWCSCVQKQASVFQSWTTCSLVAQRLLRHMLSVEWDCKGNYLLLQLWVGNKSQLSEILTGEVWNDLRGWRCELTKCYGLVFCLCSEHLTRWGTTRRFTSSTIEVEFYSARRRRSPPQFTSRLSPTPSGYASWSICTETAFAAGSVAPAGFGFCQTEWDRLSLTSSTSVLFITKLTCTSVHKVCTSISQHWLCQPFCSPHVSLYIREITALEAEDTRRPLVFSLKQFVDFVFTRSLTTCFCYCSVLTSHQQSWLKPVLFHTTL